MLKERIEARIEAYEDMASGLSNENIFKIEYQAKIKIVNKKNNNRFLGMYYDVMFSINIFKRVLFRDIICSINFYIIT